MAATDDPDTELDLSGVRSELIAAGQRGGPSAELSPAMLGTLIERRAHQHHRRHELFDAFAAERIPAIAVLNHLGIAAEDGATDPAGFLKDGRHVAVTEPGDAYTASAFDVAADGELAPGDDLAAYLADVDADHIYVPDETYRAEDAITVGTETTLMFDGTTLETDQGTNYKLFDCDGQGWHVGGNLIVEQGGSFPWIRLAGSGQFGDANGRLSFRGECPDDVIGVKRETTTKWLTTTGDSGDAITFKNIDQHEAPPYNACSDIAFTWTRYPGVMTVVGCHLGNFHDNGFYYKAMWGSVGIYDTFFDNMNVAALRHGCDHGAELKRCLVRDDGNYNPARTAGRTCRGVNHSVIAFQDKNGVLGDVHLEHVYYRKGEDPQGGEFLRNMLSNSGEPDNCLVTVTDCQWPGYPDYGTAADTKHVVVQDGGGNGDDPSAALAEPYPLGGGPRAITD